MLPSPGLCTQEEVQDVEQAVEQMAEEVPVAEVVHGRVVEHRPVEQRDEQRHAGIHAGQGPHRLV